ncbi:MAG: sigma-54 dependent transcriptional regulator [Pseudomonadota bacterium]
MPFEILVIDDEQDIRLQLCGVLEDAGYVTRTAATAEEGRNALGERQPDLILLDLWLSPGRDDGMTILNLTQKIAPDIPVIVISGHATIETAVSAAKAGAFDVIEKPFQTSRLFLVVQRALELSQLRRENRALRDYQEFDGDLVGAQINPIKKTISKVAPSESRVLISGAIGTGKQHVARMIHRLSPRRSHPFVVLNCRGDDDIERALYGRSDLENPGVPLITSAFEQAHGGTLFLQNVDALSPPIQAKLTNTLQDMSYTRLEGTRRLHADVRILATSTDPANLSQNLHNRLAVVTMTLPSLSERRSDIPALCEHFIARITAQLDTPKRCLDPQAILQLQSMDWPGNIRQLENTIRGLVIASEPGQTLTVDDLPSYQGPARSWEIPAEILAQPLRPARTAFERQYFTAQLTLYAGNITKLAAHIQMERAALYRKLKFLGLAVGKEKRPGRAMGSS